ncbi:TolC family protein [Roseateles sp. LYH14W]|uniref:Protein CyaE n=1 Tax=Pelomonas parva TaxID=3299032 RepID=A0ABW7F9Y9_9BURK
MAPAPLQTPTAEVVADPWRVMPAAAGPACADHNASASPIPAEPLTLQRAVSMALCANPRTRSAWAAVAGQAAVQGQARASLFPVVNLTVSRTRDEQQTGLGGNNTVQANGGNLTLNWLLFDFGGRRAAITQADQGLQAALGSRDAALQDTVAEVAQAWYEVQAGAGAVAAAEVAAASARDILKSAEARLAVGSVVPLDVMKARIALSQAQLATARARGAERIARGALARVMGVDLRVPLTLAFEPEASAADVALAARSPAQDLQTLVGEALAAHPALRAARAQVRAAQARLDGARAERLPSLSLSYGNYRNGRPNTALTNAQSREQLVALTLSIPLFDGFGRSYRIHEQEANLQARVADAAAAESRIAFEVWRAYQTVEAETAAVSASSELAQGAQEALAAARARHLAGAVDITEWLDAQRQDANARQEHVAALAAWRHARVRLLSSLGRSGFWEAKD